MALPNGVKGLQFERSGGSFPLVLTGEVELEGPSAGVRTEVGGRPVTDADRAVFAALDVLRARAAPKPITPPAAEAYQWNVILYLVDGSSVPLVWHAHARLDPSIDAVVPGLSGLASWVSREVDRIWAHRIGAPPP